MPFIPKLRMVLAALWYRGALLWFTTPLFFSPSPCDVRHMPVGMDSCAPVLNVA